MRFSATAAATAAIGTLALAATLPLASCDNTPASAPTTIDVTVGGKTFHCKPALDEAAREQGLGGVASLAPDEGMLFAFNDATERTFWMRGCVMGLDIAFLDSQGFVTAVHTMPNEPLQAEGESEADYRARLVRYPSGGKAKYALEVAPGTLAPLGVRRGSRAEFDREALKPFIR